MKNFLYNILMVILAVFVFIIVGIMWLIDALPEWKNDKKNK
tara:strand:- start:943 stop:1065 length:123 start_codon:yes stop_codon:yes gene_type:complete